MLKVKGLDLFPVDNENHCTVLIKNSLWSDLCFKKNTNGVERMNQRTDPEWVLFH